MTKSSLIHASIQPLIKRKASKTPRHDSASIDDDTQFKRSTCDNSSTSSQSKRYPASQRNLKGHHAVRHQSALASTKGHGMGTMAATACEAGSRHRPVWFQNRATENMGRWKRNREQLFTVTCHRWFDTETAGKGKTTSTTVPPRTTVVVFSYPKGECTRLPLKLLNRRFVE